MPSARSRMRDSVSAGRQLWRGDLPRCLPEGTGRINVACEKGHSSLALHKREGRSASPRAREALFRKDGRASAHDNGNESAARPEEHISGN